MNKGEVWIANLPQISGREQLGSRPVLVMSSEIINMIIVIPLTSTPKAEKYQYTLKIDPSEENGLDKESIALTFQVRSIDKRKLVHKIGNLEESHLTKIDKELKILLNL